MTLRAEVSDAETPVQQLIYQWTASAAGTFEGGGAEVRWTPAPDLATSLTGLDVVVELVVIERYLVPSGATYQVRENRAAATTTLHVHNSLREVSELALTFLRDFANSNNSPEYCVRNFTDNCRGKRDELEDIRKDRENYRILGSEIRVERVDFDPQRVTAYIFAPCTFISQRLSTGAVEPAVGICALTAVYEPYRWWLCTSNFCESYRGCNPRPYITTTLMRGLRAR
ncbi:MAG TPA: hypothetical protein VNI83_00460 [Vicinamibacterales bacterium]|nr:hypothetical protein [Vicinamibacterales bacterium]